MSAWPGNSRDVSILDPFLGDSQSVCEQTFHNKKVKEHIGVEIGATDERLLWAVVLIFNHDCKNALHARESTKETYITWHRTTNSAFFSFVQPG
jgi:hypothetical protein